jgi:AcrR family transcriptional regulator
MKKQLLHSLKKGGENTRERILGAALDLFSRKGFSATSVREIVHRVGIRGSSLYNHFASKEEILSTLLSDLSPWRFSEVLAPGSGEPAPPEEVFGRIIDDMTEFLYSPENKKFSRLVLMELLHGEKSNSRYFTSYLESIRSQLAGYFRQLIERGLVQDADPFLLCDEFIVPLIYMQFQYFVLDGDKKHLETIKTFYRRHAEFFWEKVKTKK